MEVAVACDPVLFDDFIGILSGNGFEGFWEDGAVLKGYVPASLWNNETRAAVTEALGRCAASRGKTPPGVTASAVEEKNWNEAWEATIRPIRVTDRIVIAPTWHPHTPRPGDIVLTIDPKMSFGTGYHETTRLMLRLMEKHLHPHDVVLDVGTGTGVLAIAALKLGAARAVGVDNDEWSFSNAKENGSLNGVDALFTPRLGELEQVPERGFGLVVANIQKNVIEGMLPGLVERTAPGGRLLFSGLLIADRDAMLASFAGAGLTLLEEMTENEWIAFATHRRH
jgi:ribosomal protein L11 methyltransferase